MKARVDSMITAGNLTVVDLTSGTEEFDLYYKLTESPDVGHKIIGDGVITTAELEGFSDELRESVGFLLHR